MAGDCSIGGKRQAEFDQPAARLSGQIGWRHARGKSHRPPICLTSSRCSSPSTPPISRLPPPSKVTSTCFFGIGGQQLFLGGAAAFDQLRHAPGGQLVRPLPSRAPIRCASARSILSPPSIR